MKAVILGGGIAGVFTALFLKKAGFDVVGVGGDLEYPLASLVLTTSMLHSYDARLAAESLEIYSQYVNPRAVVSVDILPRWADLSPLVGSYRVVDAVEGLQLAPDEMAVLTTDYLIPVRKIVAKLRRELKLSNAYGRLKIEGNKAYVVTNGERLHGDVVVLAAGWRNSALAQEAGLQLPLRPYECYAAALLTKRVLNKYSVGDYVLGWYGRPGWGPIYIAGDGCGELGQGPPPHYAERIANLVSRRTGFAVPLYVKVGYCEVGPHGGPIFGRHPEAENLYIIGGFNGYGSMVGPAVAKLLAQLIAEGKADSPFLLDNFQVKEFDPCQVSERHEWGTYLLRNV